MSKHKSLIKNTLLLNISNIFEKVIFIIINILIANYLSEESYGAYVTALSWASFFSVYTNLGLSQSLIRYVGLKENIPFYFGNSLFFKAILFLIFYVILLISAVVLRFDNTIFMLIVMLGLVRFINEYTLLVQSLFIGLKKYTIIYTSTLVLGVLFLLGTGFVIIFDGTVMQIVIIRLIIVFIFCIITILFAVLEIKPRLNFSLIDFSYCRATFLFGFDSLLKNSNDRISILIISVINSSTVAGYYQNAYLFIAALLFIPSNFEKIIVPQLYSEYEAKNYLAFQKLFDIVSRYLSIFGYLCLVLFYIFSDGIINLIFPGKYFQSISLLKILSISIPFVFTIAPTLLTSFHLQKIRTRTQIVTFIINIICTGLLSSVYGVTGGAVAFVIFSITYTMLSVYEISSRDIVSVKNYIKDNLSLIAISGLVFLIYHKIIEVNISNLYIQMFLVGTTYLIFIVTIFGKSELKNIKILFKRTYN